MLSPLVADTLTFQELETTDITRLHMGIENWK